jgi:hypothetical protein
VVASVIASILFGLFFQPIISGISGAVIVTISSFYQGYIDGAYAQAVLSADKEMMFTVFLLVTSAPVAILITISISEAQKRKSFCFVNGL